MALDDVELPAQATGNTLPGAAADLADIAPAPTAEDALLAANFGDKGAENYRNLRAAGQQAPTPLASLAGTSTSPPTAAPVAAPGANALSPVAAALFALGGQPNAMANQQAAAMKQQQQVQEQAQRAQSMAIADGTFIQQLKDKPLNLRAAMIQSYAAKQGRDLSPAEATYVADIKPDVMAHTLELAKTGDATALYQLQTLFSGDPVKMVSAHDEMRNTSAAADKMVDEAKITHAKLLGIPGDEAATAQKNALDIAAKIRGLQKPPSAADVQILDAAGLEAYQVPVRGVAGRTMWSTRPKAGATGVVSSSALQSAQNKEFTAKALAKEQATTTAATRTMKETAPKVRELANEVEKALAKIEVGPAASRLQDFMAGKIGAPNPDFIAYKSNADLLSTLLMRMHVGARGGEKFMEKFENMIGAGRQSAENMHSTLNVVKRYADIVQQAKDGAEVNVPETGESSTSGSGEISAQEFLTQ